MNDYSDIEQKIKELLEPLRKYLQADGGDVEFVRYEKEVGVVGLRMIGACKDCALSNMTLRGGIERVIKNALPEVKFVEAVK